MADSAAAEAVCVSHLEAAEVVVALPSSRLQQGVRSETPCLSDWGCRKCLSSRGWSARPLGLHAEVTVCQLYKILRRERPCVRSRNDLSSGLSQALPAQLAGSQDSRYVDSRK